MKNDEEPSSCDGDGGQMMELPEPCANNNEANPDGVCGALSLDIAMPSLKARIECGGLSIDTEPATIPWPELHSSDANAAAMEGSSYPDHSPIIPRKFVKIDNTKTPRAALSAGGKESGENATAMDFEILPDESDEEEDVDVEANPSDENGSGTRNDDENVIGVEEGFQNIMNQIGELAMDENDQSPSNSGSDNEEDVVFPLSLRKNVDADDEVPNPFESSASVAQSSAAPSSSRRRFLFAPKSPKSQQKSIGKFTSSLTNSDTSGNDAAAPSEKEKSKRGQILTTMIRKIGRKDNQKPDPLPDTTPDINLTDSALDEQDSSSDESSFDEDENWSDEESQLFDDDVDEAIDCSNLKSSLPNSFLDLPPDIYDYLDSNLVAMIGNQDVNTFAREHHLFVKGLLQLLAERDLIGVEDDVLETHNITKMGVLRKKDAKIGSRIKYVEVRKGNLTYFEDKKESQIGRTIHLRKRSCTCRVSTNREAGQDFVFELIVDGGRRFLWTAQSEEECLGWVRAINQAMIGDVDDSRDLPLDLTLYRNAVEDYQSVHKSLKEAQTRQEYLVAMNTLFYRQTSSSALRVPMKWIRDTYLEEKSEEEPMNDHERIKYAVRDFWKNLCNNTIVLNGHLVEADGVYSGERVIGALSRCILEFDKVENNTDFDQIFNSLKRSRQESHSITELEAVSYARNILNGALQSTSKGDIKAVVEGLFRNEDVAYAELESSEPLHVYVSYAGDDFSESKPRPTENVGWIETKSKKSKKWKYRYFVISEGVLSYFERAEPRPYRLGGQMVLRDAKITILEGNILSLDVQKQERLLRFMDRGDLIRWKSIIEDKDSKGDVAMEADFENFEETRIDGNDEELLTETPNREEDNTPPSKPKPVVPLPDENATDSKSRRAVRGASAKILKKATLAKNGMKRAKDATEARMKSIRTGAGRFFGGRGNSNPEGKMKRRPTNDMLVSSTRSLYGVTEKREPTVQAVVEMNNVFKVRSKASTSDSNGETLLIVRVKLYQAFLLSGGPHGRLACGDELLLMEFSVGEGAEDIQNYVLFQAPTSL
ncbi:unnamed protein product [Pseudo-nitzschia multistriata]|uniref:PH domain-containing protein n=1 Tax=Pseudo-nitzschia multistriata TaxID=183589 RepID=A0A448ZAC1_9STRA|nr:unnamed protein product [Pseudo-nitzschia multistriata]